MDMYGAVPTTRVRGLLTIDPSLEEPSLSVPSSPPPPLPAAAGGFDAAANADRGADLGVGNIPLPSGSIPAATSALPVATNSALAAASCCSDAAILA